MACVVCAFVDEGIPSMRTERELAKSIEIESLHVFKSQDKSIAPRRSANRMKPNFSSFDDIVEQLAGLSCYRQIYTCNCGQRRTYLSEAEEVGRFGVL